MEHKEKERLIVEAKESVGYYESQHKDDYMVGLTEGIFLCENFYENKIKILEASLDYHKREYQKAIDDFSTINRIFDKYKS